MRKLAAAEDKVEFVKQVPVDPGDRVRRATKQQHEEADFTKQVTVHPRTDKKKQRNNKLLYIRGID